MSLAFYTSDSDCLNHSVPIAADECKQIGSIDDIYELNRCSAWIKLNDFSKLVLQFPDDLLRHANAVVSQLEELTGKEFFVLGDTSYGSCCVDEIKAKHVDADGIIHFGHACLSPSRRLPVLYIFGKDAIDVHNTISSFKRLFPDNQSLILIIYEVNYSHAVGDIAEHLMDYKNLVLSKLLIPSKDNESCATGDANDNDELRVDKCHRYFTIPKSHDLNDYNIFYIGSRNQALMNCMLSFNCCKFFTYNPYKNLARPETLDINKYLMKRYYYIEKAKDAKMIGILVGTLAVTNYVNVMHHLRKLVEEAGKKPYIIVVGKLNSAKLSNFPGIDIYVYVACEECSIIDSHDFYQPIITPHELEIALNQAREWTGDYITDFSEILPGAAKHVPLSHVKEPDGDVSLITGKMRTSHLNASCETESDDTSALVSRDDMKISTIHSQAAGEYLHERSWKGLELRLAESSSSEIVQGRKGIASRYEDE